MELNERFYAANSSSVTVERASRKDHGHLLSLHPHPDQAAFVASNGASLDEAEDNPACVPLIIRVSGEPVGFAMYALDGDDGNYWIYRLMIDARFQRRGYGRAALNRIIQILSELPGCSCVMLGVKPENEGARRLYEHAGFRMTGDAIDGELVMRYDF